MDITVRKVDQKTLKKTEEVYLGTNGFGKHPTKHSESKHVSCVLSSAAHYSFDQ